MPKPTASRVAGAAAAILALAAVAFSLWQFERFDSGSFLSDFRAFYCAAQLQSAGVDSYRQEPLYACEARPTSRVLWHAENNVTDPAPLPPYAIAAFVPLGGIPYVIAAGLWSLVLVGAWFAVAGSLRRIAGTPWSVLAACFCLPAMMSVSLGQIAPLAIAAICVSALLLSRGRPGWAGAVAALAMIEPHVALPSCVAIFLAARGARLPMLGVGCALLAISAGFGVGRNLEYLLQVLPAHALSDVQDVGQFSASVMGHVLGLPDSAAARVGTLWYAAMFCAGIFVALRVRRSAEDWPLVALLPMAFAVFGGAYVHWQQVVAAIPAALVLLARPRAREWLLPVALVGLAIPWMYVAGWFFLIPGAVAIAGVLTWVLLRPSPIVESEIVLGVACALLLCLFGFPHQAAPPPFVAHVAPNDLADLSWGAYVRARIPIGHGVFFWLHVPTWAGLAAVVYVASSRAWHAGYSAASSRSGSAQTAGGSLGNSR